MTLEEIWEGQKSVIWLLSKWLTGFDARNKMDFRADFEIKDLKELEKIIKKINTI